MSDYLTFNDGDFDPKEWIIGQYQDEKTKRWMSVNGTALSHMVKVIYNRVKNIHSLVDYHNDLLDLRGTIYGRRGRRPTLNGVVATNTEYRLYQKLLDGSHGTACTHDDLCSALESIGITDYEIIDHRDMTITISLSAYQSLEAINVLLHSEALPIAQGVQVIIQTHVTDAFNYDSSDTRNKPYDIRGYYE